MGPRSWPVRVAFILGMALTGFGQPDIGTAKQLTVMISGNGTKGAGIVFYLDAERRAWIMTANHVVRNDSDGSDRTGLKVRFFGKVDDVDATLRPEGSVANDLAVITAPAPAGMVFPLEKITPSAALWEGATVFAVGFGDKHWETSQRGGAVSDVGSDQVRVQDPVIRGGFSGGPLWMGGVAGMIQSTDGTTARALRIDRAISILRNDGKLVVRLGEPASPPPAVHLSAMPAMIRAGESATLSWRVLNAKTARIEPDLGDVEVVMGTRKVSPRVTTTYRIVAVGPGGRTEGDVVVQVQASQ